MATVGSISVNLKTRTAGFVKGIKRSARQITRFSKGVGKALKRVAKLGAALAAVAAGGLALIVRKQLALIDSTAKLSRSLGVTIDELKAFRLAAQLGGLEEDKFDKALKRLVKSISDANNGLSTTTRAFENLGIAVEDLQGLSTADAFKLIADRVQQLGQSVTTTGALMDIFGARIGSDMLNMLTQGRAGLEAFEQQIIDMGLSLNAVDAAKVEMANDAWTTFKAIMSSIAQKITVELAPLLTLLVERFIQIGTEGEGAGRKISSGFEVLVKVIGFVGNTIQSLGAVWKGFEAVALASVAHVIDGVARWARAIEQLVNQLPGVEVEFSNTFTAISFAAAKAAAEAQAAWDEAFDGLASNAWADKLTEDFERVRRAAEDTARETAERTAREAEKTLKEGEKTAREIEKQAEEVQAIAEMMAPAVEAISDPGRFRQSRLERTALTGVQTAGERGASETVQRAIKELLERIKEKAENPEPVLIRFE